MSIQKNLAKIQAEIAEKAHAVGRISSEIELIVVTKNQSLNNIKEAYDFGCRKFGENRVIEALEKKTSLPEDISWHLIGSLQSNKINKAIGHFSLIHSVDSLELAQKISHVSEEKELQTAILLQVNISGESTKHGLSAEQWKQHVRGLDRLSGLKIQGLMTMAPLTEDIGVIRNCFRSLRQLKEEFQQRFTNPQDFYHLSMGMSHDYPIAIEEGATILRIGTAIFSKTDT